MKCFIACAFGKDDVDKIYENAIVKVLKELDIEPLRVDKIEYNENIDLKIIDLIKNADFCIADLTYARPSVYYEAGYVNGMKKPVVFTVRKDHFHPKELDIQGYNKVHFDLQMKNIIDWTSTSEVETFKKRLISRINHVTKPIMEELFKKEKLIKETDEFNKMSIEERINNIYKEIEKSTKEIGVIPYYSNFKNKLQEKHIDFYVDKNKKRVIDIEVTASATLDYLKQQYGAILGYRNDYISKGYEYLLLVISLRSIPIKRIEDAYPSAKAIEIGKRIIRKNNHSKDILMYFVSNCSSLKAYKDEIEKILEK